MNRNFGKRRKGIFLQITITFETLDASNYKNYCFFMIFISKNYIGLDKWMINFMGGLFHLLYIHILTIGIIRYQNWFCFYFHWTMKKPYFIRPFILFARRIYDKFYTYNLLAINKSAVMVYVEYWTMMLKSFCRRRRPHNHIATGYYSTHKTNPRSYFG